MPKAPSKEERAKCWAARDSLFKCLDENDNDRSKCAKTLKKYEGDCPGAWASYFLKRRDFEKFKADLAAGKDPVDGEQTT